MKNKLNIRFIKRIIIFSVVVFIFSILFPGCNSDEKGKETNQPKVEHYIVIITPTNGQSVKSGENFKIEITLAQQPDEFQKVVFKLDDEEIFSSDKLENAYVANVNSSTLTMGMHTITTELIFSENDSEINTATILITSDVIPKNYSYMVRNTFRHDNEAYTQGLEFKDGKLYEGTGLNGKSEVRQVDLRTGNVLANVKLDAEFFGEGITIIGDKLYQITYQSHKGFVYDLKTLKKEKEFVYATEGWGLTHDEKHLIMSDGTNKLYFLNHETFEREKEIEVFDNVGPIYLINELEYIDGEIWANVYLTQDIIRIDPKTGKVIGKINCSGIFDPKTVSYKTDVLNGIAYDQMTGKIYITGKLWPTLYEVEILNEH